MKELEALVSGVDTGNDPLLLVTPGDDTGDGLGECGVARSRGRNRVVWLGFIVFHMQ